MKLSIEQVQKMAELQEQVAKFYKEFDFSNIGDRGVQMTAETFIDTFETFAVRVRGVDEYPYELSTVAGGTLFFTIMRVAEVVKLENTHPEKFQYISHALQRELA